VDQCCLILEILKKFKELVDFMKEQTKEPKVRVDFGIGSLVSRDQTL
jgi:hypothetical protein